MQAPSVDLLNDSKFLFTPFRLSPADNRSLLPLLDRHPKYSRFPGFPCGALSVLWFVVKTDDETAACTESGGNDISYAVSRSRRDSQGRTRKRNSVIVTMKNREQWPASFYSFHIRGPIPGVLQNFNVIGERNVGIGRLTSRISWKWDLARNCRRIRPWRKITESVYSMHPKASSRQSPS